MTYYSLATSQGTPRRLGFDARIATVRQHCMGSIHGTRP
jgi:hypothetical protein